MASIFKWKNATYIVQFALDGKRPKLYGFTNRRQAEQLGDKIEQLKAARLSGIEPPELTLWIGKLENDSPELYERLYDLGLLPRRVVRPTIKTILDLTEKRYEKRKERTLARIHNTLIHLPTYFGADKPVDEITTDDAVAFLAWYRTAPLNRRHKVAEPYSRCTVNRDITTFKSVFSWAVKLGVIRFNPFAVLQSGASSREDNKDYISVEIAMEIIEKTCSLKWKTILALGRFAGCRGACDLCLLNWSDVQWSSPEEPGSIILRGKTRPGMIPLAPVLESLLGQLFEQVPEGVDRVFPEFSINGNTSMMTRKYFCQAGYPSIQRPWYSLRTSFCNDILSSGIDLKDYQSICRHSLKVALESYQKFHAGRVAKALHQLSNCAFMSCSLKEQTSTSPEPRKESSCSVKHETKPSQSVERKVEHSVQKEGKK